MPIAVLVGSIVVLVAACGGSSRVTSEQAAPPAAHVAVVPWRSLPAVPAPPYGPPLSAAPPCSANDVKLTVDGHNGASQHQFTYVSVQNISPTACAVSGYPKARGVGPGVSSVSAGPSTWFSPQPPMAFALDPGVMAGFNVVQSDECDDDGPPPHPTGDYRSFEVALPGGGSGVLTDALPTTCPGLAVTTYTHAFPVEQPLSPMMATIKVPPTVPLAAAAVQYTVTLSNPTTEALPLEPCPNHEEFAHDGPSAQSQRYELNCAGHTELPPGHSLTFAMRAPITGHLLIPRPHDLDVSWQLEPRSGNPSDINAEALATSTLVGPPR